jgi:hypothetical protein
VAFPVADLLDFTNGSSLKDRAAEVFARVWRFDFTAPGFCLLDLGPLDTHALRGRMLELKDRLSDLCLRRTGRRFIYRSLGRFDQQVTTKFHLDGAPSAALLVLGYEPSTVRSRLFLADYTRCAFDLGLTPEQFLNDLNPMFRPGEQQLAGYVTELPAFRPDHAQVLLINNSSLPCTAEHINPLGVMHKAEIVNPTPSAQRLVNSIMLGTAGAAAADLIGTEGQRQFVETSAVNWKA